MTKKIFITLGITLILSGCAGQGSRTGGMPWWGWLLLILALVVIVYIIVRGMRKGKEVPTVPPMQPEPVRFEAPLKPDDLTVIEGIGPKIQSVLQTGGINTYQELANLSPENIKQVLDEGGIRLAVTDTWPEQARLAAEGKMDDLKELQDQLTAGRN